MNETGPKHHDDIDLVDDLNEESPNLDKATRNFQKKIAPYMALYGIEIEDFTWEAKAVCNGLSFEQGEDPFFPDVGGSSRVAREFCSTCDVAEECFAVGVFKPEVFGIWGGMGNKERQLVRKAAKENVPWDVALDSFRAAKRDKFVDGYQAKEFGSMTFKGHLKLELEDYAEAQQIEKSA